MSNKSMVPAVATSACIVASLFCSTVEARPRSSKTKRVKEEQAYMQLEMFRYQSEMAAKQQEILTSFDKDGDGKLSPPEKAQFDKHMHDIQKGAVPNPFAFIKPVGQGPRPKSPIDELKDKATEYQAGMIAKQREIISSFDANGDGELKGPEKSKFDRYMHDVQTGKAPNPFAAVGSHVGAGSGGK